MLLIVGWDGACFELVDRFRREGRLPVLDGLLERGRAWNVASTIPPVTFPAWTSFLTGVRPDHHGITDFTIPRSDGYGVRFVNSSHRAMPTLLRVLSEAGRRVGMYGMPATYPPEGRGVFEICGFDTPLGATASDRAAHPSSMAAELRRRHGRLGIEGLAQSRIDEGWHEKARVRLLDDIALRTTISLELLASHPLDVFFVHFMEPDTASHHFWQFDDEASPRHREGPRGVLADVYAALDASLGRLLATAGPDPDILLLSDHGSAGASDRRIFWNRWLADSGWLTFHAAPREPAALRLKRAAMALLPPSLQARVFSLAGGVADRLESGARFAGIDWSRTRAYSDEVPYFPSIRLNVASREKDGVVAQEDREDVLAALTRDLLDMRDPFDDGPVVLGVRRREELFDGPFSGRYPDLVMELRRPGGYAYAAGSSRAGLEAAWCRRLTPGEDSGAKGTATGGVHGDVGMAVVAGPRADLLEAGKGVRGSPGGSTLGAPATCTLPDLGVTTLDLAGVEVPARMQGRSVFATAPAGQARRGAAPRGGGVASGNGEDACSSAGAHAWSGDGDYSEEEEREVAERLRALGYLP